MIEFLHTCLFVGYLFVDDNDDVTDGKEVWTSLYLNGFCINCLFVAYPFVDNNDDFNGGKEFWTSLHLMGFCLSLCCCLPLC